MSKKSDTDEDKLELSPLVDASKSKKHSNTEDAEEPIAGTSMETHICMELTSKKHPVHVVSGKVDVESEYWKAIQMAIQNDDDKELKAILDKNMDQACYNLKGWTILQEASVCSAIKCFTYLIDLEMFDINARDENGKTLLHFAAECGPEELETLLLHKGSDISDINCRDKDGKTLLHFAAECGLEKLVKFLLDKGSDINCRDIIGRLPLHYAVETGDLQCIRLLVEKGCEINCRDKTGRLPLHYAVETLDLECVRLLVKKGSEINCRDKKGRLPLHYAAEIGFLECVRLLVEKGSEINCRDNYGMTGLHYAVKSKRDQIVKMFLERKADINARDEGRPTVIMIAANAADSIFQSLLEEHPDTTLRNDSGQTVFHVLSDEDKKVTQQKISNLKKLLEFEICTRAEKKQAVSGDQAVDIPEDAWNRTKVRKKTARELIVDDQILAMNIIRVLLRDGRLDTPRQQAGATNTDPNKSSPTVDYNLIDTFIKWIYEPNKDDSGKKIHGCSSAAVNTLNSTQDRPKQDNIYLTTLMIDRPEIAKNILDCFIIQKPDGKVMLDYTMLRDKQLTEDLKEIEQKREASNKQASGEWSRSNTQETGCCSKQYNIKKEDPPLLKLMEKIQKRETQQQLYQEIMLHPLVQGFVRRKWQRIGVILHILNVVLYLAFLVPFTFCIVESKPRLTNQTHQSDCTQEETFLPNETDEKIRNLSLQNETDEKIRNLSLPNETDKKIKILMIYVILLAGILIIKEMVQVRMYKLRYFKQSENWHELFAYVSSIVFAGWYLASGCAQEWQHYVGVVSISFTWFNLRFFVKKIGILGVYVVMFDQVAKRFIPMACIFIVIFIGGFGVVFYSLCVDNNSITSLFIAMLTGEVGSSSIFEECTPNSQSLKSVLKSVFVILYIVVVTILVMNLMTAVAVDDIQNLKMSATEENTSLQADLVIRVEGRIWKIFRKLPQRMKCIKKIREYFFFDLVEEIDLDKKDETYGLPIDDINTILKQEKKDVFADILKLNNRLDYMDKKMTKQFTQVLENLKRNDKTDNNDSTAKTGTGKTTNQTGKEVHGHTDTERKIESLSRDINDLKDMIKTLLEKKDT